MNVIIIWLISEVILIHMDYSRILIKVELLQD